MLFCFFLFGYLIIDKFEVLLIIFLLYMERNMPREKGKSILSIVSTWCDCLESFYIDYKYEFIINTWFVREDESKAHLAIEFWLKLVNGFCQRGARVKFVLSFICEYKRFRDCKSLCRVEIEYIFVVSRIISEISSLNFSSVDACSIPNC